MDHCFFHLHFFILVAWLCSSCFECVLSLPRNCRLLQSAGRTSLIRVEWEWSSGIFQAHSNVQSGATCSMSRLQPAQTPEMGGLHLKMNNSLTFMLLLMLLVPLVPISCWLLQVFGKGTLLLNLKDKLFLLSHLKTPPSLRPISKQRENSIIPKVQFNLFL